MGRLKIAGILLAAGRSTRMGAANKLLANIDGKPLVRLCAETALASSLAHIYVVTGHDRSAVERALAGLAVTFVHNARHAEGMSGSIRAGLAALPVETAGAMILLADMPHVDAALIDRLIARFGEEDKPDIVAPVRHDRIGNPVLWARPHFAALAQVTGDKGGRDLMRQHRMDIATVAAPTETVFSDIDTPQDLAYISGDDAPTPRDGPGR